jgi:hypothetical protein
VSQVDSEQVDVQSLKKLSTKPPNPQVCESILSKMTAQTSVVEKQKLELAGQQRAMRGIESKLNAETEFSAQYLKELKAISGKCKEPLKEVLGHHINGIGRALSPKAFWGPPDSGFWTRGHTNDVLGHQINAPGRP